MTKTTEVTIRATGKTIAATISETKVTGLFGDEYAKSEVKLAHTRVIKTGGAAKHLYSIGIALNGVYGEIDVEADTRSQAAAIVKRLGFEARDCNMVG